MHFSRTDIFARMLNVTHVQRRRDKMDISEELMRIEENYLYI